MEVLVVETEMISNFLLASRTALSPLWISPKLD